MPPRARKLPKWVWEFIEYIDDTTKGRNKQPLSVSKKLFEEHYEIWYAQKPSKTSTEPKPKRDMVASSVGNVIEKLATMDKEEREQELQDLTTNLKEKIGKIESKKNPIEKEICSEILTSIQEGIVGPSPSFAQHGKKRQKAIEIHRSVKSRCNELCIEDEKIETGIDTLYNLAVQQE